MTFFFFFFLDYSLGSLCRSRRLNDHVSDRDDFLCSFSKVTHQSASGAGKSCKATLYGDKSDNAYPPPTTGASEANP